MTRRGALERAAAAGAGVALAGSFAESARATVPQTAAEVLHALATLAGDAASGHMVVKAHVGDYQYRVKAVRSGQPAIFSAWQIPDRAWAGLGRPILNRQPTVEIDFPAAGTAFGVGTTGDWTYQLQRRNIDGTGTVVTDPTIYTMKGRFAKGGNGVFSLAFGTCFTSPYPTGAQMDAYLSSGTRPAIDDDLFALRKVSLENTTRWPVRGHPLAYFHLGDWGYPDAATAVEQVPMPWDDIATKAKVGYQYAHLWMQLHPDVANITKKLAVFSTPDDHEYGQDGAYRRADTTPTIPPGAFTPKDPYEDFAAEAYQACFPMNPFWDYDADVEIPNYRSNIWFSSVEVFMLDNRRWADPQGTNQALYYSNGLWYTQLGEVQRDWLKNALAASTAEVKVVTSPMAFHYSYSLGERNELLEWIFDNVDGRVIFVSGDLHNQAHVQWRPTGFSKNTPVDELLCSPVRNNIAPFNSGHASRDTQYAANFGFSRLYPNPGGPLPVGGPTGVLDQVIGALDFDTTISPPDVTVRILDGVSGNNRHSAAL